MPITAPVDRFEGGVDGVGEGLGVGVGGVGVGVGVGVGGVGAGVGGVGTGGGVGGGGSLHVPQQLGGLGGLLQYPLLQLEFVLQELPLQLSVPTITPPLKTTS